MAHYPSIALIESDQIFFKRDRVVHDEDLLDSYSALVGYLYHLIFDHCMR
jgi:hypothetical protein